MKSFWTNKNAYQAAAIIQDYCRQQPDCQDCIFNGSVCTIMEKSDPESWPLAEIQKKVRVNSI